MAALTGSAATVTIGATYRPVERAYLMHWCCQIASGAVVAANVPLLAGVDIDWTHAGDVEAAGIAAHQMRREYGIAYPAALASRHTDRLAVDMTIRFVGTIEVRARNGMRVAANTQRDLWSIGASYGVIKLPSDPPHWSVDGH